MKMSEIKDLTLTELSAKGRDLRQEIFNLRLQQASSRLEKPAKLREIRRDIARVLVARVESVTEVFGKVHVPRTARLRLAPLRHCFEADDSGQNLLDDVAIARQVARDCRRGVSRSLAHHEGGSDVGSYATQD